MPGCGWRDFFWCWCAWMELPYLRRIFRITRKTFMSMTTQEFSAMSRETGSWRLERSYMTGPRLRWFWLLTALMERPSVIMLWKLEDHGVLVPKGKITAFSLFWRWRIARYGWQSVMDWRDSFQIPRPDVWSMRMPFLITKMMNLPMEPSSCILLF